MLMVTFCDVLVPLVTLPKAIEVGLEASVAMHPLAVIGIVVVPVQLFETTNDVDTFALFTGVNVTVIVCVWVEFRSNGKVAPLTARVELAGDNDAAVKVIGPVPLLVTVTVCEADCPGGVFAKLIEVGETASAHCPPPPLTNCGTKPTDNGEELPSPVVMVADKNTVLV